MASPSLRARLGQGAAIELVELLDGEHQKWSDRVLNVAVERFERRLTQEVCGLHVALVQKLEDGRVQTLKWAFAFWIGQFAAFAGLLAFMFRFHSS